MGEKDHNFDINIWMGELFSETQRVFGGRLIFFGLQGSFARGEAGPGSDADVVAVFDKLDMKLLKTYRDIVLSMPFPEKACGFIGGAEEVRSWPGHDLFNLYYDTKPFYGDLALLLAHIPARDEAAEAVKNGASCLYHAACHNYLYDADKAEALKSFYKASFFILRAKYFYETGEYVPSIKELGEKLEGEDGEILRICAARDSFIKNDEKNIGEYSEKLINFCGRLLRSF